MPKTLEPISSEALEYCYSLVADELIRLNERVRVKRMYTTIQTEMCNWYASLGRVDPDLEFEIHGVCIRMLQEFIYVLLPDLGIDRMDIRTIDLAFTKLG